MQQDAKQKIQELVEKYEKVKTSRSVSKYTEEETKKDFILPLFRILGGTLIIEMKLLRKNINLLAVLITAFI